MHRVRFLDSSDSVRSGEWTDGVIESQGDQIDPAAVEILPPVDPSKVLGVGYNYSHEDEESERPDDPVLWVKGGPNVVSAHERTVNLPRSMAPIFEAELGVVIGKPCKNVSAAEATEYVEGFTCANDITNRAAVEEKTWFRLKTFDGALPLGPVLATPEHVADNPRIRLWQNGELRQDSTSEGFYYTVPEIVSAFSQYITLERNDVIIMGTPSGNDRLNDGDTIRIEIEGIGRLEHDVVFH